MKRKIKRTLIATVTTIALSYVGYGYVVESFAVQAHDNDYVAPSSQADKVKQGANGKYADVNGLKMYYEINGSGQPLVLLHGAFGFNDGWVTILPTLAKSHQVIAIELQGHGHTNDVDRPLTYDQMAEDVGALLKQLKIKDADFFGYSMGGTVAFAIAIRHPELVRKVATYGSCLWSPKDTYDPEAYKRYQSLSTDFAPPILKEPYDRMSPDPTRWPVLVTKIKNMGRDFKGYSAAEAKAIKAQVLIMMGDHDAVRPEHAVEMYRMIANSQLAILPGADHFLLWSSPDKLLAVLVPFLDASTPEGKKTGE